jgi:predicted phosphoribosyltransferase
MKIFNRIRENFHLRLKDRQSAGNILGETLKGLIKKEDRKNCLVLGIPRGGVITGSRIAEKLGCKFGVIISRKITAPHNKELAIGAITGDGIDYLNDILVRKLEINSDYIAKEKSKQLEEINRRISIYCHNKKTLTGYDPMELNNKIVVLADDGTATGATLIAAKRSVMSFANIRQLIIASPIAPKGTIVLLKNEGVEYVEILITPSDSQFKSVEQYYEDFHQLSDEEVVKSISSSGSYDS